MGSLFDAKTEEDIDYNPYDPAVSGIQGIIDMVNGGMATPWSNFQVNGQDGSDFFTGLGTDLTDGLNTGQDFLTGALGWDPVKNGGPDMDLVMQMADNPFITGMIDSVSRDVTRNFNENTMPGIAGASVSAGHTGDSSRRGAYEAISARGAQDRVADISSNIRGENYRDALLYGNQISENNAGREVTNRGQQLGTAGNLINSGITGTNLVEKGHDYFREEEALPFMQAGAASDILRPIAKDFQRVKKDTTVNANAGAEFLQFILGGGFGGGSGGGDGGGLDDIIGDVIDIIPGAGGGGGDGGGDGGGGTDIGGGGGNGILDNVVGQAQDPGFLDDPAYQPDETGGITPGDPSVLETVLGQGQGGGGDVPFIPPYRFPEDGQVDNQSNGGGTTVTDTGGTNGTDGGGGDGGIVLGPDGNPVSIGGGNGPQPGDDDFNPPGGTDAGPSQSEILEAAAAAGLSGAALEEFLKANPGTQQDGGSSSPTGGPSSTSTGGGGEEEESPTFNEIWDTDGESYSYNRATEEYQSDAHEIAQGLWVDNVSNDPESAAHIADTAVNTYIGQYENALAQGMNEGDAAVFAEYETFKTVEALGGTVNWDMANIRTQEYKAQKEREASLNLDGDPSTKEPDIFNPVLPGGNTDTVIPGGFDDPTVDFGNQGGASNMGGDQISVGSTGSGNQYFSDGNPANNDAGQSIVDQVATDTLFGDNGLFGEGSGSALQDEIDVMDVHEELGDQDLFAALDLYNDEDAFNDLTPEEQEEIMRILDLGGIA